MPKWPLDLDGRPDEPAKVMQHAGRYSDGTALVVLGGPSGKDWIQLRKELRPDVIIGVNGVNAVIKDLQYWMCPENMGYAYRNRGEAYWRQVMNMFYYDSGAQVKMTNFKNWIYLKNVDKDNYIKIKRSGHPKGEWPASFSLREYGNGFMSGWNFLDVTKHSNQQVGTSGAQALHLAGILGCKEVHTIGFDMLTSGHFYNYPKYRPDHFRRADNFVDYKGYETQEVWLEGARWLDYMLPYFDRDGLKWVDHSNGLFKLMGMKCTVSDSKGTLMLRHLGRVLNLRKGV